MHVHVRQSPRNLCRVKAGSGSAPSSAALGSCCGSVTCQRGARDFAAATLSFSICELGLLTVSTFQVVVRSPQATTTLKVFSVWHEKHLLWPLLLLLADLIPGSWAAVLPAYETLTSSATSRSHIFFSTFVRNSRKFMRFMFNRLVDINGHPMMGGGTVRGSRGMKISRTHSLSQ